MNIASVIRWSSLIIGLIISGWILIGWGLYWIQLADEFGWGFFWFFILVPGPIMARFNFIPFRFMFNASESLEQKFWYGVGPKPKTIRIFLAIFSMALGLWLSGQVAISVFSPLFSFIYGEVAFSNFWLVVGLSILAWILSMLYIIFIFPFSMLIFMIIAKGTENYSATHWAIQYRSFVRGTWPFMSWTLQQGPKKIV